MRIESVQTDAELIAAARASEVGQEIREQIAGVLHCTPESLHPDAERRADA